MATVTDSTTPTYDYSMIGSVGGEAAQSVNGEMINKIRAAEEKSLIDPITEDIDNIELEAEKLIEIKEKITEFQDIVNYFDIYNEENVFNQFLFDGTGSSAVFDAVNMSSLKEGTTSVEITQLAQKDVFQSAIISSADAKVESIDSGTLSISIGGAAAKTFETTADMTFEELAAEIDKDDSLSASVEQVGDSSFRLVVKSVETGTANELSISGLTLGFDTGNQQMNSDAIVPTGDTAIGDFVIKGIDTFDVTFTNDGTAGNSTYEDLVTKINAHNGGNDFNAIINDNNEIEITMSDGSDVSITSDAFGLNLTAENLNHTLKAQNMNANIDGVQYDTSSNSITTQGSLKITAIELGVSSVSVSKDTSAVLIAAETMITQYTELQEMLDDEIYSAESVIEDKGMLKDILADIKNMIFASYGATTPIFDETVKDEYGDTVKAHSNVTNNDKNLFVFGFELNKSGNLTLDTELFSEILNGENDNYNFDDLKSVFTGSYENKGVGVQLKEYLDSLDAYEGKLYDYDFDMIDKKENLEKEKESEVERLDAKYGIMAEQFSSYSALISQMESQFSGLKMMIEQSTSGN